MNPQEFNNNKINNNNNKLIIKLMQNSKYKMKNYNYNR